MLGAILGALGGGGAILAVPALVYLLGVSPSSAVATSLVVVGLGAVSGLSRYARSGRVAWGMAVRFGVSGAFGSFLGVHANQFVSGERLLAMLGALMLVAAALMVRSPRIEQARASSASWKPWLFGLGVGVLTGFFGVGGGFVIVPALTLGLGLSMTFAAGTSLAIIVANSAAGLLGYAGHGAIDWAITAPVALGSVIGAIAGGQLAGRVQDQVLRRGFALMVSLVAVVLIYRNAMAWTSVAVIAGHLGG
ncbi:MAG: sulfite exporter TauE/SafE family protein [Chloroflexota bacterium]